MSVITDISFDFAAPVPMGQFRKMFPKVDWTAFREDMGDPILDVKGEPFSVVVDESDNVTGFATGSGGNMYTDAEVADFLVRMDAMRELLTTKGIVFTES